MIVWEDKWHEWPELPSLGDYVQMAVSREFSPERSIAEGTVVSVLEDGTIFLAPDLHDEDEIWDRWRRGALPEHRSVERRQKADA